MAACSGRRKYKDVLWVQPSSQGWRGGFDHPPSPCRAGSVRISKGATGTGLSEAGHWEGDLIICKCTRPVLVLHERKSRVTLAARLTGKTAAETISAMLAVFGRIDPHLRRSITFDNDTAFAQHGLLRTMRDMTTWFCDAYASWQKGGVENANGRFADGCRATSISTATRKSRRSSSRPTSRPVNASGSRRHSKPCLPSLEKMFKSASLNLVALRSNA